MDTGAGFLCKQGIASSECVALQFAKAVRAGKGAATFVVVGCVLSGCGLLAGCEMLCVLFCFAFPTVMVYKQSKTIAAAASKSVLS